MISEALNVFLLAYVALFPIVNPLGSAPVFLNLTQRYPARTRHKLAARVAINGFVLLLGSLFVGAHVLDFFGLTLPIVRIAGGCVVSAMAWQLLREGIAEVEETHVTADTPTPDALQQAFYPLTMPLTVGPGSIATAITLGSQRPISVATLDTLIALDAAAVVAMLAIAVTIYLCYRFADTIGHVLGRSGTNVLIRLSAFILLCIGFQIIWNGYASLMAGAPRL
jgi:multiple antibiotic resistance protein